MKIRSERAASRTSRKVVDTSQSRLVSPPICRFTALSVSWAEARALIQPLNRRLHFRQYGFDLTVDILYQLTEFTRRCLHLCQRGLQRGAQLLGVLTVDEAIQPGEGIAQLLGIGQFVDALQRVRDILA